MAIEPKIFEEVTQILAGFGGDYLTDRGALKRGRLIEDLDKYKPVLMKELLGSELIRKSYVETIEVADKKHEIFKLNQFVELFTYKEYWADSYTKFSNKIGLTAGGKFIDETADVVLDFPFKDCVLKAGMTKEDAKDVDEAFLNEVIAKPEIDTLLEPKIFVNAKRYNKENLEGVPTEDFDENDNLIIKGNNLIALHSIKERYAGKVKLIYIDPPYNTGNDSFNYNDSFNHSAWLTFMKNRLEIARELLSEDGSIWINIDNSESHYLKILCDNVFRRENFVSNIIWQNNKQSKGYTGKVSLHHNELIVFRKAQNFRLGLLPRTEQDNINYKNPDNDVNGPWRSSDVRNSSYRPNLQYNIVAPDGSIIRHPENGWRFSKETFEKEIAEGKIKFSDDNKRVIRKIYLSEQEGRVVESVWNTNEAGSTRLANSEIKELFGTTIFATPKPENLLSRIIAIGSNENDLVLDFFMGSATTQAVAMKMKRRFIGIEQMDYINSVSVERLKKVIDGEQGGISKAVNWQGGGSFIYAELFEKNQGYLKDLLKASDTVELNAVYERMLEGGADFDFRVDLGKFEEEKAELSFEKQKEFLIKIIDKNQLYYQYSEIEDENVRELISDSDLKFNEKFYGEE